MIRHLPNVITLARVAAAPGIAVLLVISWPDARMAAFVLFIVASITDYVDGWLARRLNVQSRFGTMLDPIADKLLIAAALIMLSAIGTIPPVHTIAVVLILSRELLVSGLRDFLAGQTAALPVSVFAKWKTTIQMVAVVVLLVPQIGEIPWLKEIGLVLLWLAAAASLLTAVDYLHAARRHLEG